MLRCPVKHKHELSACPLWMTCESQFESVISKPVLIITTAISIIACIINSILISCSKWKFKPVMVGFIGYNDSCGRQIYSSVVNQR